MEGECCKQLHSACVKSSSRSTVVEYNVTCRGWSTLYVYLPRRFVFRVRSLATADVPT